jgi:hypothetical protein
MDGSRFRRDTVLGDLQEVTSLTRRWSGLPGGACTAQSKLI